MLCIVPCLGGREARTKTFDTKLECYWECCCSPWTQTLRINSNRHSFINRCGIPLIGKAGKEGALLYDESGEREGAQGRGRSYTNPENGSFKITAYAELCWYTRQKIPLEVKHSHQVSKVWCREIFVLKDVESLTVDLNAGWWVP